MGDDIGTSGPRGEGTDGPDRSGTGADLERFREILDSVSDWVWEVDRQWRYTYSSPQVKDVLGYLPEEVIGRKVTDLMDPEEARRVASYLQGFEARPSAISNFENVNLHRDGRRIVIETSGRPIFDVEGSLKGYRGIDRDITQRKDAEKDRMMFRAVFDNSPMGIVIAEGEPPRISRANRAFCEMLGCTEESLRGMTVTSISHTDDHGEDLRAISDLDNGRIGLLFREKRYLRSDGTAFWARTYAKSLRAEIGGGPLRIAVIQDIEDTKRSEERLRTALTTLRINADKYRSLFQNANDAIFIMKDDIFQECNDRTLVMFGCTRDEIIGHPPYDFSPPTQPDGRDSREKAKEHIQSALEGHPRNFEWVHMRRDGTLFDAEVSLNSIDLEDGVHLQAIVRDITDRKRFQEELKRSEERFRSLFNLSPAGIALIDLDGNITDVNEAQMRLGRLSKDEIVGRPYIGFDEIGPEQTEELLEAFASAIRDEEAGPVELRLDIAGEEAFLELHPGVLKWDGEMTGLQVVTLDITDKKRYQIQLEEERNRAKLYLDLLGHDIGNLHQGMHSGLQLALTKGNEPEKVREVLGTVMMLVKRSIALVRNVLLLSRIKQKEPDFQRIDAIRILKANVAEVEHMFPAMEMDISISAPREKVHVMAEPILSEVFLNILHNAVKVQFGRAVRIGIEVVPEEHEGEVRIDFTDHGSGLSDAMKEWLMSGGSERVEGVRSGIGLSLVRELTSRYNGRMEVLDRVPGEPGMGARFRIVLPACPEDGGPSS